MTLFITVLREADKQQELISAVQAVVDGSNSSVCFATDSGQLSQIPGSPFAYWVSSNVRATFDRLGQFESEGRKTNFGAATKDDFRFLRTWWEINPGSGDTKRWFPFSKGGAYSRYYSDIYLCVNWQNDAREIEASLLKKYPYLGDTANWVLHRECDYFRRGFTWTYATTLPFSARALPAGCVFGHGGPAATSSNMDDQVVLAELAIVNSNAFQFLISLRVGLAAEGRKNYDVGVIQKTPYPEISESERKELAGLSFEGWEIGRKFDAIDETSHAYLLPEGLMPVASRFNREVVGKQLEQIQTRINEIVFDSYDFCAADRDASLLNAKDTDLCHSTTTGGSSNERCSVNLFSLLSWCIGISFGRFDLRLTTGEREAPPKPGPFDPLPTKSPGMLPDGAEPFHPHAGILVDDPGHQHDLPQLIESVLERVDIQAPDNVRGWLQKDFFKEHLKQYSKSRRKAPIYWPLATASASYTLWVYYPDLDDQTLYTAINDFLEPKRKLIGDELSSLRAKSNRSAAEERELEKQQDFEQELIELRDTILEIAPTYKPNHDDGVQITAAPLWPLFRHKPWQKVLKDTWEKLEAGEYDWTHLAHSYWPDRVREKCKTDKSLAIAHGLEDSSMLEGS